MTNEDTPVEITLDGSDPDGDDITFQVSDLSGSGSLSGDAPILTYTPSENFHGTESFSYVVFDGELYSDEAIVTITVVSINDLPTVDAGADQTVTEGEEVNLVGSVSDEDGTVTGVLWTCPDTSIVFDNANNVATSFIAPDITEDTNYTITLTVTDDSLATASDEIVVSVLFVAVGPIAAFGADTTEGYAPLSIQFQR